MTAPNPALQYPFGYVPGQPFWTLEQQECFIKTALMQEAALFMEPRCGKSAPIVNTGALLYKHRSHALHTNAVLIVAWPNGVHSGWIKEAFPENMPKDVPWMGMIWRSNKAGTKHYAAQLEALCNFKGLAVLAVNAEAIVSETCRKAIAKFYTARKRLGLVADESSFMTGANNRRTKIMDNLSKRPEFKWKRILDGTPAGDNGPFDYFTQIRFLNRAIFGFTLNSEFKARYAEWDIKINHGTGQRYPVMQTNEDGSPKFRNMEELWGKIDPISYRATFAQCFNVPKQVFQNRRFELTKLQRAFYDDLAENLQAELADGTKLTVNNVLTKGMRLQQVTSNYFPSITSASIHPPCDGEGCEHCQDGLILHKSDPKPIDPLRNPRLEAFKQEIRTDRQYIVWCKFRQDAEDTWAAAAQLGMNPVRYDGSIDAIAKENNKSEFQAGRAGVIVCNERSAARGIPLWKAYGHIWYSHAYSLRDRLQAEQRSEIAHRKVGTSVVNLVAEDTIDDLGILPALRAKLDVATFVMRDPTRKWF